MGNGWDDMSRLQTAALQTAALQTAAPFAEVPARVSALGPAGAADMALINARAQAQLSPEDVYVFEARVSTDALNDYFCRMAPSSLANFVEDGRIGNPLMAGHDYRRLNFGRSYDSRLERSGELESVVFRDYMLRGSDLSGVHTDEVARNIEAGILTDISITYGGCGCRFVCGLCGLDLLSADCPHVPGLKYEGAQAFAWVEDAHSLEHSIVFSGADPGAEILSKAQQLAARGWKLEMPEQGHNTGVISWSQPHRNSMDCNDSGRRTGVRRRTEDDGAGRILRTGGEGQDMTLREVIEQLGSACRQAAGPEGAEGAGGHRQLAHMLADGVQQLTADLTPEADSPEADAAALADGIAGLLTGMLARQAEQAEGRLADLRAAYAAAGVETPEAAAELRGQCNAVRAELIDEALTEGVRAHGSEFQRALYEPILREPSRSLAEIRAFRDGWRALAARALGPAGRVSTPGDGLELPAKNGGRSGDLTAEEQAVVQRLAGVQAD